MINGVWKDGEAVLVVSGQHDNIYEGKLYYIVGIVLQVVEWRIKQAEHKPLGARGVPMTRNWVGRYR